MDLDLDLFDDGRPRKGDQEQQAGNVLKVENVTLAPRMEGGSRKVAQRYAENMR